MSVFLSNMGMDHCWKLLTGCIYSTINIYYSVPDVEELCPPVAFSLEMRYQPSRRHLPGKIGENKQSQSRKIPTVMKFFVGHSPSSCPFFIVSLIIPAGEEYIPVCVEAIECEPPRVSGASIHSDLSPNDHSRVCNGNDEKDDQSCA